MNVNAEINESIYQGLEVEVTGDQGDVPEVLVERVGKTFNSELNVHLLLSLLIAPDGSFPNMESIKAADVIQVRAESLAHPRGQWRARLG